MQGNAAAWVNQTFGLFADKGTLMSVSTPPRQIPPSSAQSGYETPKTVNSTKFRNINS